MNHTVYPQVVSNRIQQGRTVFDNQPAVWFIWGSADMYGKWTVAAALLCFAANPVLAGDAGLNWTDISKDLKDLKADYKDLKTDQADLKNDKLQFKDAIANGKLEAASKYATDIAADKKDIVADRRDIRADIKDLKHDGVTLPKGKH